jgi:hypothetical protein
VHSVLMKQKKASAAVADLEQKLIRITGFHPRSVTSATSMHSRGREHGN